VRCRLAKPSRVTAAAIIGLFLVGLAACSPGPDYAKQFAAACTEQGLTPGSPEHDKCVQDHLAQQRERDAFERSQFELLQATESARPLMAH
jgi:hypothetical protein